MESGTRNVLLIVVLVVVALCCCLVAAAVLGFGWFTTWTFDVDELENLGQARVSAGSVRRFEVGGSPALALESFAGAITIRVGEGDSIQVRESRRAPRVENLNQIDVQYEETRDGLRITSRLRRSGLSNTFVEFDIAVPADTDLTVDLGAGEIDIRGVRGSAGVKLGAGSIEYDGEPVGDCRFETGAGEIVLRLPANLNAEIDLDTGIGEVDVAGFDVAGQVSRGRAQGRIGRGGDASIFARTGAGRVELGRR
jgi:hypothetical protein